MSRNKRDVSIEYAHIYTNNKIGKEHEISLEILGELKKQLSKNKQTYSLMVMVDDYSFPDPTFSYDFFVSWLKDKGYKPDLVIRESQLIPLCDNLLSLLKNKKLHGQLVDYIKTKKYPCSLFIAAWYLLRLGYFQHKSFDKKFYAKELTNILPKSFKEFEDKALEIIGATKYAEALKRIEYLYIEGRLLV